MNTKSIEVLLAEYEKQLPPVVFRNWHKWHDVFPFSPRSVANDDSKGLGPVEKIHLSGKVGYPRAAFIDYLKRKLKG